MLFRPTFTLVLVLFLAGCQRSPLSHSVSSSTNLSADTIASVHWLGKRQLDLDGDAYFFSRIWSLPETARLQSQTFDRFSTGIWRVLLGEQVGARIPGAVLRPLLDELMERESYLEIRATPGLAPCFVLATQVSSRYAGIWETNTAIAAGLICGVSEIANHSTNGWTIAGTHNGAFRVSLTWVAGWAVIASGPIQNEMADEIMDRIRSNGVPFVSSGTNFWFEADIKPAHLLTAYPFLSLASRKSVTNDKEPTLLSFFDLHPSSLNQIHLALSGDGGNVITRARLAFTQTNAVELEPWRIPVELLHGPLASLTAMRGVSSCLAHWPVWNRLSPGTAPDQFYLWSLSGTPYQIYLAAPWSAANVASLTGNLLQNGNPWLAAHDYISFDRMSNGNGVTWGNLPDIKPFIRSVSTSSDSWLYAGLFPDTNTAALPPPSGLIQDILRRTNLVYYDWEVTGSRLPSTMELAGTVRLIARQPQMPLDSPAAIWLRALTLRLGTSATIITRTGPDELTVLRRSTIGLTAVELHLLTGWLESPNFLQ
jgi:hypothetical protein